MARLALIPYYQGLVQALPPWLTDHFEAHFKVSPSWMVRVVSGSDFNARDLGYQGLIPNCSRFYVFTFMKPQRKHAYFRIYACDLGNCKQMFYSSLSKFHDHLRAHIDDRPFECPRCDKRFSLSGNLQKHVLSIHQN